MDIGATIKALKKRWSGTKDEQAEGAQAASEEVSKALPKVVMPRDAVVKKRADLKKIDEQTRED